MGNLGDDIIQRCFSRLFSNCSLTFCNHVPPAKMVNAYDHFIVGGGSIWPNKNVIDLVLGGLLKVPFSLVGISSRDRADSFVTEAILEKACSIIVRDSETKRLFNDDKRVVQAPDISWLDPLEPPPKKKNSGTMGLNLRNWDGVSWDPSLIVNQLQSFNVPLIGLPFFYGEGKVGTPDGINDDIILSESGVSNFPACVPCALRETQLVVAMRFHTIVLAAQAAIPFIGFDYHPKTSNFCNDIDMADACVPLDCPERLLNAVDRTLRNGDEIREKLLDQRPKIVEHARGVYSGAHDQICSMRRQPSIITRLKSGVNYLRGKL